MKKRLPHLFSFPLPARRLARLACLLCAVCLSGCAGNIVTLSYPPAQPGAALPPAGNRAVCVVDFANNRTTSDIGRRQNGDALLARTPVERWLALGVAQELRNAGYRVDTAETMAEAVARQPEYIVTGEVEEVWLAESSLTRYTGTIRASISLLDGNGGYITRNAYNSTYSKTVLPVYGVPQTLLDDALAEMLQPAVRLLVKTMQ